MKRNCNLELRLVTPSVVSDHNHYSSMVEMMDTNDKQQLTIFYNGRVAVCDATELQARAIIWLASHEMEEKSNIFSPGSDPTSPLLSSSLYSPNSGISMKRSLKRFLQKRKTRAQATSPYTISTTHSNHN